MDTLADKPDGETGENVRYPPSPNDKSSLPKILPGIAVKGKIISIII